MASPRCIDILSFTHQLNYLSVIQKYLYHWNPYVRESAVYAIKEISGYAEKNQNSVTITLIVCLNWI